MGSKKTRAPGAFFGACVCMLEPEGTYRVCCGCVRVSCARLNAGRGGKRGGGGAQLVSDPKQRVRGWGLTPRLCSRVRGGRQKGLGWDLESGDDGGMTGWEKMEAKVGLRGKKGLWVTRREEKGGGGSSPRRPE